MEPSSKNKEIKKVGSETIRIIVVGTGYVGLVTGTCFAELGFTVTCVDNDRNKIDGLKKGKLPIYEPGLEELVRENVGAGRLTFATDLSEVIEGASTNSQMVYFIAVGTPPGEDGSAELRHVLDVAREIGSVMEDYSVIVDKSTVPVGTAHKVREVVLEELQKRDLTIEFDVVSNPEFLKEGAAIDDFMRPDRVIVGTDSDRARQVMEKIYEPFTRNHHRMISMGVRDAEMTKYVANAMLATKISFMNEVAGLCEELDVDIESVRLGIGSDPRIGFNFIYAGCGYGGSCLPKDVKALISMAKQSNVSSELLQAVEERNERQKHVLFEKIQKHFGTDLSEKKFAIWGLSFKPGTDDMREAPSLVLIQELLEAGASISCYDPVSMEQAREKFPDNLFTSGRIYFAKDEYETCEGADAMVLVTEWKPFRRPDFNRLGRLLRSRVIFDGRNQYDPAGLRQLDFQYYGIGRNA